MTTEASSIAKLNVPAPRGRFITVEGAEGAGKTTNIEFLETYLQEKDIPYILTREPGGTPLAEEIRETLLEKRDEPVDEDCELLLVFAARAQHLNQKIIPALNAGTWVLCDRFTDATFAYQGGGRGLSKEKILFLEEQVQQGLSPDLTVLLDLPVEVGMARARQRAALDRFESEQLSFFERVRESYLERASADQDRFRIIDTNRDLAAIRKDLQQVMDTFCEGNHG